MSDEDLVSVLIPLFQMQPWLADQESLVMDLFNLCGNGNEVSLLKDLLGNFRSLQGRELSAHLAGMASQIREVWQLPAATTQLLCVTPDDEPDSAQLILQLLRLPLEKAEYRPRMVNRFTDAAKTMRTHHHIVLVDEFVGSGQTMANRVASLRKTFENERPRCASDSIQIHVCVLAAMENARPIVFESGVEFVSQVWLKAGISGRHDATQSERAIADMLRLEALLDQQPGEREDFPSLGYGKAESLYRLENGNCPNSVFPLFWWKWLADGRRRETLLVRHMSEYAIRQAQRRRGAVQAQGVQNEPTATT